MVKQKKFTPESFQVTVDQIQNYAIFSLNLRGEVTSWNKGAEHIHGWRKEEVLGRNLNFLYPEEDQKSELPTKMLLSTKEHGVYEGESWLIRKDTELFFASITISKILDEESGDHVGYIQIGKDMTNQLQQENEQNDANTLLKQEIDRRQKIEEALKLSNEELDAFASAASHDLQEPLRMVVSYLQLLERRYTNVFDKDGKEFLAFAIDGATRMRTLISDLVEYSRIDTFGKPFTLTDANEAFHRAVENLEVSIRESHVQITYDQLPSVLSDEVQLTQLFQNLLANAIKFRNEKPLKIHVGLKETPKVYEFSIADNGRGIAEKDLENIFVIFKQLGKRADREGSGLGLAISKKIVSRHHGKIWAKSVIGKGSTFFFTIPKKI